MLLLKQASDVSAAQGITGPVLDPASNASYVVQRVACSTFRASIKWSMAAQLYLYIRRCGYYAPSGVLDVPIQDGSHLHRPLEAFRQLIRVAYG